MLVTLLITSQTLVSQVFLGGSGQDLATQYTRLSGHSSVCSEKIFNVFGPVRFKINEAGQIFTDSSLFIVRHNQVKSLIVPDSRLPVNPDIRGEVDTITANIYPLHLVGLRAVDLKRQFQDNSTNQSDLKLHTDPAVKGLVGKGSDSIKNLANRGFSKPITYPKLLGELWYSCSVAFCSELDFLTAIAQVSDCALTNKPDSYAFEPDIEKIRARYLRTYTQFGTPSNDFQGLLQTIRYRAYELAPQQIIRNSISDPKMFTELDLPNDKRLIEVAEQLKRAAMDRYIESGRKEVREFKDKGKIKLAYGYSFTANIIVEMKDGLRWMI